MARNLIGTLTRLAFVLLLSLGTASAQRLAEVLPAETILAFGVQDLASHSAKFDALIREAESLGLGEAFAALFGESDTDLEPDADFPPELSAALEGVEPLDVFGVEAWLALSVSSHNPMPALTLLAELGEEARGRISDALQLAAEERGAESLSESGSTMHLFPVEADDSPFPVLALSQTGEFVVASTNPDELRGVLRRLAGSDEAGFSSSEAFAVTLAELGPGNGYSFLDYSKLAEAIEPFGAATGFEGLVTRVLTGLGTIGTAGSVTTIEEDGLSSASIRTPGSGDPALAALLTGADAASREPLAFVPSSALAVNVSHFDLRGWWNYLSELALSSSELGNPDLDEMVMQFTGIDLRVALFDWLGSQAATITGEIGTPAQPGVPSENLLGESVYLLQATDETAADQGLSLLLGTLSGMVAGFADPSGEGAPGIEQSESSGVQATSYRMGPGVTVAYAVTDGWALIATSAEALDEALAARGAGADLPEELDRLAGMVPGEATSYSLTNLRETLAQSGAQTAAQMQMFAGLSGGELDFDALQSAGEAIEAFFALLAERAGGSVSYSVPAAGGAVRTIGVTEFNW